VTGLIASGQRILVLDTALLILLQATIAE